MLSSADHESRSAKNEVDPKQWSELYGHPVEQGLQIYVVQLQDIMYLIKLCQNELYYSVIALFLLS